MLYPTSCYDCGNELNGLKNCSLCGAPEYPEGDCNWKLYDAAAEWCAKHNVHVRNQKDLSPFGYLGRQVRECIFADLDAFNVRVKGFQYAMSIARNG